MFAALLFLLVLPPTTSRNILVVLLDDVDDQPKTLSLGLPNVTNHFRNNGVIYNNAFVTTPICCPSRASILTGTYQHNHRTFDNSVVNGCDGPNWDMNIVPNSMGKRLHDMGYKTGMFGKYSNNYNGKEVPPGWDEWMGLKGNSVYYNYTLNRNGKEEKHGDNFQNDYLPELILQAGIKFMTETKDPWFAYLSFPTAHEPFDAAPEHQNEFKDSTPTKYPTYNMTGDDTKHWYTRSREPMTKYGELYNTQGWQRRLSSLQTIDKGFLRILKSVNQANTTIVFTSDNGFLFGEFGMFMDKRQPYEVTIRVPMFVSGPLFPKGSSKVGIVLNIDIAPTVVDVAKQLMEDKTPEQLHSYELAFDGQSLVPGSTQQSRSSFVIEYNGEGNAEDKDDCSKKDMRCWYKDNQVWATPPHFNIPQGEKFCFCEDSRNNTFICERRISAQLTLEDDFSDFLHCHFPSGFSEFYDLHQDPFQQKNVWGELPEEVRYELMGRLEWGVRCRGLEECSVLNRGLQTKLNEAL